MKFLFVDDDDSILLFLEECLSPYASCVSAQNGTEAVSAFDLAMREGAPFTAVFMDILMPDMDGNRVVRELRHLEAVLGISEANRFKLVMISVCTDTKNVSESFFGGMADAYIPKPLRVDVLLRELKRTGILPQTS
ncbi:response regulator [Desulfolutivibrio sulfoxidireducens]|uniref:response regulator n=1 Tax=Desulfolutivibrio sulfoxidireducens TaxID=2773299 RepID=UPI00159E17C7|nr:response regulator [Desulfolutivibrio sulfoxidireducens]QLA17839.1 response regulator [Desulfolutivibrio sulfoxidireducens]QLA21419.1 response regulator [Desulfolutivibrio sulfoxidireducens]